MSIDETMDLAKRHHLAGEFDQAGVLYRRVLHIEPRHGKALFFSGLAASQQGDHQTAVDLISRAIAVEPAVGAYHLSLAQNLLALNQHDEAIAAYRRAVALQPNLHEAFFGMGVALQAIQKH